MLGGIALDGDHGLNSSSPSCLLLGCCPLVATEDSSQLPVLPRDGTRDSIGNASESVQLYAGKEG